jgi:hypothetical protein
MNAVFEKSQRLNVHEIVMSIILLLSLLYTVITFCIQHTTGAKFTTLEISLNTKCFLSLGVYAEAMAFPQKY